MSLINLFSRLKRSTGSGNRGHIGKTGLKNKVVIEYIGDK